MIAEELGDKAPPDALLFRRDYLEEVLRAGGRINAYYVIVDRKEDVPATIASIDETFLNSSAELTVRRKRVGCHRFSISGRCC